MNEEQNNNLQIQISNLQEQVNELLQWKADRIAQQISYPLDPNSNTILNKYFLSVIDKIDFVNPSGGIVPNILTLQDGVNRAIQIYPTLYQYGVNITTDVITVTEGQFNNDDKIFFLSTGDFPVPFDDSTVFHIINSTGKTFQVSTTMGGSAVNITSIGTGKQFLYFDQL